MWWAWSQYGWALNAVGNEGTAVRIILVVAMAGSLILAQAVPDSFAEAGVWFAVGYVLVRYLGLATYWIGLRATCETLTSEHIDVMTLKVNTVFMTQALRRSTIYLDPELHRALRIKAAETDRSISELVSDAVKSALAEDAEDLQAFDERASEPDLLFETVVRALKADGKI